jgi:hypothetical protein
MRRFLPYATWPWLLGVLYVAVTCDAYAQPARVLILGTVQVTVVVVMACGIVWALRPNGGAR